MAHPDTTRQGNEKGQREHAGRDSEATDAGTQRHAQNLRGPGPRPADGTGAEQPQRAGGAGAQAQRDETSATPGQVEGADHTPSLAPAAGGHPGANAEAAVPPGESRILEGRPAIADRGLEASSQGPAGGLSGTPPSR